jgi:hypothetical protein
MTMPAIQELSVRFTAANEDAPLNVSLFRPDTGVSTPPAPFTPPLDDAVLADIRWYLEMFSTWPSGPDYDRANEIESQMRKWGNQLLESITSDREAVALWQQFVDAPGRSKLLTMDATDPRVLRLPWELLADKKGHLFARSISIRRRLQQATTVSLAPLALPVRILIVVSRPKDAGFIDPRAVSVPLLDALDNLHEQVEVEFLYPPTLTMLTERLSNPQAPPVHIVHFDGHGVYDAVQGLGYLLFEDENHIKDLVDAERLGTLLYDCGVPLIVLNACQSAKQEVVNPYASVAASLIQSGLGSVLAMNYSVLVVAARKFVEAFYGSLARAETVGQAVDNGRRRLLSDEKRHTLSRRDDKGELVEQTVRLRDWFLPALYQQSADPVVFSPSPRRRGARGEGKPTPSPYPLPDPPRAGFHGRAREMLALERAFAERNLIVLHGFGGMGKTTLAAEAGRWFTRTGRFPGGAAFISFEHGGSLEQLCSWIGQAISGDPDFVIHQGEEAGGRRQEAGSKMQEAGSVSSPAIQNPKSKIQNLVDAVGALLREKPALIILDNFESVLGRAPLIPPDELKAILDAVHAWAAPPTTGLSDYPTTRLSDYPTTRLSDYPTTRLLITTRDTTFNDARFTPSKLCRHIELGGLATDDALELAAAVLDDHSIDRARIPRQALVDLMERLGGHPLSLTLALPALRDHTPDELNARFEELLPGFTTGAAKERNESLSVSLDFSLRRLGAETRAHLPKLAVFQGGCMEYDLLAITQMDAALWEAARVDLEAAALVTVETIPGVKAPFLRFHPTLIPYLTTQLPNDQRAALEERYWREYYKTANMLYRADTQTPHQAPRHRRARTPQPHPRPRPGAELPPTGRDGACLPPIGRDGACLPPAGAYYYPHVVRRSGKGEAAAKRW